MSQSRKMKRNKARKYVQPEKGKKVMKIMITGAIILIIIMVFLGVQSYRNQAEAPSNDMKEIQIEPEDLGFLQ